jgi:hypothetical protein
VFPIPSASVYVGCFFVGGCVFGGTEGRGATEGGRRDVFDEKKGVT